jgi:hypothetical protein
VTDPNPKAGEFHPFLNVTRRKDKHGVLPDDDNGKGIFTQMKAVKGHPGHYSYKAEAENFPGYWLVTKGTWYVQVQQVDSSGTNGQRVSPIEEIHIS